MRLGGGSSSSAEPLVLEPSATVNDLPSEVLKSIFSFVGKGSYYTIGPVSKDFCYNYLTVDVFEDKFAHKMDFLQAIGKNRITTAEAASSSIDLAEYCFFKAPEDFQKKVVNRAIGKGRKDIVEMGEAMGIDLKSSVNLGSGMENFFKIARRGDLEMLKFLHEKGIEPHEYNVIHAAAENNELEILNWVHEKNFNWWSKRQEVVFLVAGRSGQKSVIEWAKDVAGFDPPSCLFNYVAASGHLEIIKYLRSKGVSWDEHTFVSAASSGNIALLQFLLENDCPHDDPDICVHAVGYNDHEKALEVLQWLHSKDFPWDENTCTMIAKKGNLKALKYARLNGCPWNEECLENAVEFFHLEIVEYCLQNDCPIGNSDSCRLAMLDSNHDRSLKMLKILREYSVPWSKDTCLNAATIGNLHALKYAISNDCPWDRQCCLRFACEHGNTEVLNWMRSHGVVFDERTFATVALSGHLETLKWLKSQSCPMDRSTFVNAILSGNISVVEYCIEKDFPFDDTVYECAIKRFDDAYLVIKLLQKNGYPWHPSACKAAAYENRGDLKLLRWLRYNGCTWDEETCTAAVMNDNLEMLKYAHENGCKWTKETYACCFTDCGLNDMVDEIPTDEDAYSDEILNYLKEHDCPRPDFHDWSIRGWE